MSPDEEDTINQCINTAVNIINLGDSVSTESVAEMAAHIADQLASLVVGETDEADDSGRPEFYNLNP